MPRTTAKRLTRNIIKRLPAGREHRDSGAQGLYLYRWPSGKMVWILRYRRPLVGTHAKLTLGLVAEEDDEYDADAIPKIGGILTPEAARALAAEQWRLIKRAGVDPAEVIRDTKQGIKKGKALTFEWACREFILRYSKPKNRRWKETSAMLGIPVLKSGELSDQLKPGSLVHKWRKKPIADLKKRDVLGVLDDMVARGSPYAANAMFACLRKMFGWLIVRDVIHVSPCQGLTKPHRAEARDRTLTDLELAAFWQATGEMGRFGRLFRTMLLTAQRRDEVRLMHTSEIEDADTWTIPRHRMKMDRPHVVPLTPRVRGLIADSLGERKQGLVFGPRAPSGFSKSKRKLDELTSLQLNHQVRPWRLHDLRRSAATLLQRLGVRLEVTESILAHRSGSMAGIVGVYQRWDYAKEKREALELLDAEVMRIVERGKKLLEADPTAYAGSQNIMIA